MDAASTPRPAARPVTMVDVARAAGVSRALVSIVMRDAPGAGAETRVRVREAAERLGYRPNTAARVLRRERSRLLGVVFTPRNPFEVEIVEGVYAAAEAQRYQVFLSAMTPERRLGQAVEELLGHRCEALLLVGFAAKDTVRPLDSSPVPLVQIGRGGGSALADVVRSDDRAGAAEAVDFLVGLGHRRMAHVDGGRMPGAKDRRAGFLAAMRAHGLADHAEVLPGDYTEEGGARAARMLLGRAPADRPTAVVTGNDWSAFGLLSTFAQAGVAVPEEVSVVGYDDSRIAQLPFVQLSSVRQDAREMGELAVRAADERLSGERVTPRDVVLRPRFVPRATTGAAPDAPRPGRP